jgi:hypothetical protein
MRHPLPAKSHRHTLRSLDLPPLEELASLRQSLPKASSDHGERFFDRSPPTVLDREAVSERYPLWRSDRFLA